MRVSASQGSGYHCPSFLYSRIFAKLKDPSQPLLIVSDELLNKISAPDIFNQHHFPSISCLYFEDNSLNSSVITIGYLLTTNYIVTGEYKVATSSPDARHRLTGPLLPRLAAVASEHQAPSSAATPPPAPARAHSSLMGQ